MSPVLVLVLAVADNGVIGDRGGIPWRIADDLKRFKALTLGKPLIVGRKTWDSFPKKPLPGRTNIVVTRDAAWQAAGAVVAHSLDEALARAGAENPSEIVIAGGAEIYRAALPLAGRVELTEVHANASGDTHFPPFDRKVWRETAREDHAAAEGLGYSYVTLVRA
ncbi:MAG TPA: dihydrofolate reductase [Rhizomicrobium sp.]|jgi:dihydrofolate reductase|nr:dihydrofolate reductase [Rhizomicrobium sp.]